MTLYLCLFREGGAYLSTAPDGDANEPVEVAEQEGEVIAHLLGLQSFVAAQALASLYLAGVTTGGRGQRSRRPLAAHLASRSEPSGTPTAA